MMQYKAKINGLTATVSATVNGKYYPATNFEPEEFPEAEIIEVIYEGVPLPMHFWDLIQNQIEDITSQIDRGELKPNE